MSESRILAVKIDGKLFDKLDEFVEETKITKRAVQDQKNNCRNNHRA